MWSAPSGAVERHWWWTGVVVLAVLVVAELTIDRQINGVYAGAAVVAGMRASWRQTAGVAALATVTSVASGVWNDNLGSPEWAARLAVCVLLCGVAVAAAAANGHRRAQLIRITTVAQRVLDALALELTGARTVKDVAEGFVGHTADTLGATSAMYLSLDADGVLRSVTWHGRAGSGADRFQEVPLTSDLPGAVAARERVDLHYHSRSEIVAAFPDLAGYYPADRSLHVLPLHRGGQVLGVLALTFPVGLVTRAEEGFLHSVATALTSAVVRARELQASDAATQRTALLAEASLTLSRSLSTADTVAEVGRLLVPRFADWCMVQLLREGRLETVTIRHRDDATTRRANELRDAFPTDMDLTSWAPHVVRTGRSEIYPFVPADLVDAAAVDDEHRALLRRLGVASAVVAPLSDRQGVVGAVTLIHAESGRSYTDEDVVFVEEIASRVGVALGTAAAFEQQSARLAGVTRIAEASQRAILATPPERVGPFAIAARYHSATVEAQVGGDLYEVVTTPTTVRLLVGDVRGKGLAAVRTATVVLGAFRAAAAGVDDPAELAREVDVRLLPYLHDDEEFVTGVFVDVAHDGRYCIVSCGNPAPVLLGPGGRVETLELSHAPPLGFGLGVLPVVRTGRLEPGQRLLLHTDGLIEARTSAGAFIDPHDLLPAVAGAPLATALDDLLSALTAAAGHRLDDDLALLLLSYEPGSPDAP
ncbi:GAF domain-containing SpoIIE family protein phosphatase [Nocardioides rubriscoriae]|uniref:GAF domain-containing SpoIIE family protein phosphatase n=1 Tax=Nocardioides rubriscoriae TaxID=642762 RepID=UPI0011E00813|nr:GAF domain-containing SpoIIE family protein phosphatase [Nocardioides rubriscoriae]